MSRHIRQIKHEKGVQRNVSKSKRNCRSLRTLTRKQGLLDPKPRDLPFIKITGHNCSLERVQESDAY